MKKRVCVSLIFFAIILLSNFVAASEVAYILKYDSQAKPEILDVFSELNLNVDLIEDADVLNYDLSDYDLVFVDDARLRKTENIPIYNYPCVIMNKYYGEQWGLTDNDGVSQLASTAPLNVKLVGDGIVQVYTQAKYNSISIPYYFLDDENKANMQSVARTYTGNTYDFGDVVAVAPEGTHLINGKVSGGKICFYGIAKTKYWTEDARDLFVDCVESVVLECVNDDDCSSDYYSDNYCDGDNVYKNLHDFSCVDGECVEEIDKELVQDCEDTCIDGECVDIECYNDAECGAEELLNDYCIYGEVYSNYSIPVCLNAGEPDSECKVNYEQRFKETCEFGCENGECLEGVITCSANEDCGQDGFIDGVFCDGPANKDVWQNYRAFTCENPGTISSSCSTEINPMLVTECDDACIDGACVSITCYNNAECDDVNSYTYDQCINPGTVNSYCSHETIQCLDNSDCDDSNPNTLDTCNFPGTIESYCSHEGITCSQNSDCGIDGWLGDLFCNGPANNDIWRNYRSWTCENPGTTLSSCSQTIAPALVTECDDTCIDGACVSITCYDASDCDDGNSATLDYCNNPGTIESYCSHEGALCSNDNDCGSDRYIGGLYCKTDDIYRDFMSFVCSNPSAPESFCSNNIEGIFLFVCEYACADGFCIRCNENPDCNDDDLTTKDICWFSGTIDAFCTHEHIGCFEDAECGDNGFIDLPYCTGNNVFQDYRTFDCVNKGTVGSYCDADIETMLIEECGYGCSDGSCVGGVHDVALVDFPDSIEGIRLEYTNGTYILADPAILICDEIIKAKVKIENQGDYFENIILTGNLNGDFFLLNDIPDLTPGDSTYRISLSPYITLPSVEGIYNITIEAIIPADKNPTNNFAVRQIEIICPECFADEDCASDYYTDNYCEGNNVYRDLHDFSCVNNFCEESIIQELVEECSDECVDGECVDIECYNDAECDDSDLYTYDQCNNPGTENSYCSHTLMNCITDNDCGTTGFIGEEYCFENDVYKNNQTAVCVNSGTIWSYCDVFVFPTLIIECGEDYCDAWEDNYCKDDDVWHSRTCYEKGCLDSSCFTDFSSQEELVEECAHGCENGECIFECIEDSDCENTECDYLDGCYDKIYRDYHDVENNCINNECEENECVDYDEEIWEANLIIDVTYFGNYGSGADMSDDIYVGDSLFGTDYVVIPLTFEGEPIIDPFVSDDVPGLSVLRGEDENGSYVDISAYGHNSVSTRESIKLDVEFGNSVIFNVVNAKEGAYENPQEDGCGIIEGNPQSDNPGNDEYNLDIGKTEGSLCSITNTHTDKVRIYYEWIGCGADFICGNNIIEPGEECDEGINNSDEPGSTCSSNCELRDICENADLVVELDPNLWVVGENCHNSGHVQDSVYVNIPWTVQGEIYGRSSRGNPEQSQTNEVFYLSVNCFDGPVSQDDSDPGAITTRFENLGSFHFNSGLQTIYMNTASVCPPDNTAGSVGLDLLCIYLDEPIPPECVIDEDCGDDYYSDNYCDGDNVYRDLHDFSCVNNFCEENIILELVEKCSYGCENGECITPICQMRTWSSEFVESGWTIEDNYKDYPQTYALHLDTCPISAHAISPLFSDFTEDMEHTITFKTRGGTDNIGCSRAEGQVMVYDNADTLIFQSEKFRPSACGYYDEKSYSFTRIPSKIKFTGYFAGISNGQWNGHIFFDDVSIFNEACAI